MRQSHERSRTAVPTTSSWRRFVETVKHEKGKDHIDLISCIPEGADNFEIYSDPLRIQQILTNLLGNALKFSEKGSIEFGFELKEETVEFFVKDEGIGIEPGRKKLIFNRFEHLDGTTKKYEGTGLGLSISKGLAELLGATLSVESKFGIGTTFRLCLPLKTKALAGGNKAHDTPVIISEDVRPCTVLVAEDEELNQKLILRVLKATPFKILLAKNGQQAVHTYQANPGIDVVLMDIRMPVMNGDVAAQEILKINENAKIIAQTAFATRNERDEFLQIGFVDIIAKPFKPKALLATINKWRS